MSALPSADSSQDPPILSEVNDTLEQLIQTAVTIGHLTLAADVLLDVLEEHTDVVLDNFDEALDSNDEFNDLHLPTCHCKENSIDDDEGLFKEHSHSLELLKRLNIHRSGEEICSSLVLSVQEEVNLEQVEDTLDPVEDGLERVEDSFERVEGSSELVEDSFERVEGSFQRMEDSFQPVEESFQRVEGSFQRIEDSFQRVEERFDRVEDSLERMEIPEDNSFSEDEEEGLDEALISMENPILRYFRDSEDEVGGGDRPNHYSLF